MKRINLFLSAGLIILVSYTLFAIQNRISVPVRLTFGEPKVYSLALIALFSFIGGAIFGCVFTLICRRALAKEQKPVSSHTGYSTSREEVGVANSSMQTHIPDLEYGIEGNIASRVGDKHRYNVWG